jgi:hypothetical protein
MADVTNTIWKPAAPITPAVAPAGAMGIMPPESNNSLSQVMGILEQINQILNNPVIAKAIMDKKLGATANPAPQVNYIDKSSPPPKPNFTPQMILEYLKTSEGKKAAIEGLNQVKAMFGDITISRMIEEIEKYGN